MITHFLAPIKWTMKKVGKFIVSKGIVLYYAGCYIYKAMKKRTNEFCIKLCFLYCVDNLFIERSLGTDYFVVYY